ncbi:uncharacterized protein Bfra_008689 [Botrytis fragariae]|uniref:Uncharacterized protein n=1 Tax=Botrytis fragariae TaxID=1964551 RepID=A0A8H6EGV5_9HELO|nr:uncharacterized protein Bfra_008689 [Botrytis fragariae]KAF5871666.1 hypothetical protein Bfra_008689 [Botrytis fragariae]
MHALRTVRTVATVKSCTIGESLKLKSTLAKTTSLCEQTVTSYREPSILCDSQPLNATSSRGIVRRPDTCFDTYPGTDITRNTMFALQVLSFVVHIIFSPSGYPFSSVRAAKPEVQAGP